MKKIKFAISSLGATRYSTACFPCLLLRSGFEKANGRVPFLAKMEKHFNTMIAQIARSALNDKLVGANLFEAVELHLTDPRMFYDPVNWQTNEAMIKRICGPIASFHSHMEFNPILSNYKFNLCDNSLKTRKAIDSQLDVAYRIMNKCPHLIKTESPVMVFHAGVAKNESDKENALMRTRESIEYISMVNKQLYETYGKDRKLIPTIENSAREKLTLGQTVAEWQNIIRGFEDEVKLTLDYGHIQTVRGEKDKLLKELKESSIGNNIVNLHLHYSPTVDREREHAHASLSRIPLDDIQGFEDDILTLVDSTAISDQGYITLELISDDPLDYVSSVLWHAVKHMHVAKKLLEDSGIKDWTAYRGTSADHLASLRIAENLIEAHI